MNKKLLLVIATLFLLLTSVFNVSAVELEWQWSGPYGGDKGDWGEYAISTSDGYIIVGNTTTKSFVGSVADHFGGSDALIIKLDKSYNQKIIRAFGGSHNDYFDYVIETTDGHYLAVGRTLSNDISGLSYKDGFDAIIVKFDKELNVVAKNIFGGSGNDRFWSVCETPNGYVAVGSSDSSDISGMTNKGDTDAIIITYNFDLTDTTSINNYGGNKSDEFKSVVATSDGGYVAGGSIASTSLTDSLNLTLNGVNDALIVKFKNDGSVEKYKSVGSSIISEFTRVITTSDGGYVAVGWTYGDIGGISNKGFFDGIIVKFDDQLSQVFVNAFGGNQVEQFFSVCENDLGKFMVVGSSFSIDIPGFYKPDPAQYYPIFIQFDKNGTLISAENYEFGGQGEFKTILQVADDTYLAIGRADAYYLEDHDTNHFKDTSLGDEDVIAVEYKARYLLTYNIGTGDISDKPSDVKHFKGTYALSSNIVKHSPLASKEVFFIGWSLTNPNGTIYKDPSSGPAIIKNVNITGNTTVYAIYSYSKGSADPNTGDNSNIELALIFMGVSVLAGFVIYRKKQIKA